MTGIHLEMPADSEPFRKMAAQQAYLVGCDRMPWFSRVLVHDGILTLQRDSNEGGSVRVPWQVPNYGDVVLPTACLMQRERPYQLETELARGQVTQLRNQLGEWELAGWIPGSDFHDRNTELIRLLREAIIADNREHARQCAVRCLSKTLDLAESLCLDHAKDLLARSQEDQRKRMSCVLDSRITSQRDVGQFASLFGHVTIPVLWGEIEPRQGDYHWDRLDRQIESCAKLNIPFSVGPLIDFHKRRLPEWLLRWQDNPRTFSTLLIDIVESCVGRYQGRVQEWATTIGTNNTALRGFNEEQHLWLTRQLLEAAQDVDPYARFSVGIRQPWGEYLLRRERCYCPFSFVDTLLRVDLPIHGIDLEIAMGYPEEGSYCRSLLDLGQLLDHYSRLNVPLHVILSFPSERPPAFDGCVQAGSWHGGPAPAAQAEWLEKATTIALAKPAVERVTLGSYRDSAKDAFPFAGLLDGNGVPKPSFAWLQRWLTTNTADLSDPRPATEAQCEDTIDSSPSGQP